MTDRPSIPRFDYHVCLISGQLIPNITPLLSDEWRPKKVFLVASPEVRNNGQVTWMQDVLRILPFYVKSELVKINDAYNPDSILDTLNDLFENLKSEDPGLLRVAVNMTGGTKPMTIAAQDACDIHDVHLFYIDIQTNKIQLRRMRQSIPIYTPNPPVINFKLQQYLRAYGMRSWEDKDLMSDKEKDFRKKTGLMLPKEKTEISSINNRDIYKLVIELANNAQTYGNAIRYFNKLASTAKENKTLLLQEINEDTLNENTLHILDLYLDAKLILRDKGRLKFKDESSLFFVNGGWLEDYVFDIVRKIQRETKKENIIQDVRKSYRVLKADRKITLKEGVYDDPYYLANELDIAFISKNRLFVIECKTKHWDNNENSNMGSDTLYKLDSISNIGGIGARGMLISYHDVNRYIEKRAKDLRVRIVKNNNLRQDIIEQQIKNWIYNN